LVDWELAFDTYVMTVNKKIRKEKIQGEDNSRLDRIRKGDKNSNSSNDQKGTSNSKSVKWINK